MNLCAHAAAPLAQAERNETAPDGATIPLSSEAGATMACSG